MSERARLLDILSLEPLMPYFEPVWHKLRPVSRAANRWAQSAYEARRDSLELDFLNKLDRCKRLLARRVLLFETILNQEYQSTLIESMAILTGTASIVYRIMLMEARRSGYEEDEVDNNNRGGKGDRIRTLGDIVDRACTSADFGILIQVPLPMGQRLAFVHIQEMMAMVGELRMIVAPQTDPLWCFRECGVDDAADAYAQIQMHRWAWPDLGLANHWTLLDI